jgi:hypothetical protein
VHVRNWRISLGFASVRNRVCHGSILLCACGLPGDAEAELLTIEDRNILMDRARGELARGRSAGGSQAPRKGIQLWDSVAQAGRCCILHRGYPRATHRGYPYAGNCTKNKHLGQAEFALAGRWGKGKRKVNNFHPRLFAARYSLREDSIACWTSSRAFRRDSFSLICA